MRYAVARLEDLESIPGAGSLTWRPVRAHFDLRTFGCNAYTAAAAGEDVVEPHDEAGGPGHEELYFVQPAARASASTARTWTQARAPTSSCTTLRCLAAREAAVAASRQALELVPAEQRDELRSDMLAHPALADLPRRALAPCYPTFAQVA